MILGHNKLSPISDRKCTLYREGAKTMHYLILGTTFIIAAYATLNYYSRGMIYQPVPVKRRR